MNELNKVNNEIIPQIVSRLQPEIEKSLMEMKEDMILELEAEISSLIDSEMEALEYAKENKKKVSVEFEQQVQEVQKDINELQLLMVNIE